MWQGAPHWLTGGHCRDKVRCFYLPLHSSPTSVNHFRMSAIDTVWRQCSPNLKVSYDLQDNAAWFFFFFPLFFASSGSKYTVTDHREHLNLSSRTLDCQVHWPYYLPCVSIHTACVPARATKGLEGQLYTVIRYVLQSFAPCVWSDKCFLTFWSVLPYMAMKYSSKNRTKAVSCMSDALNCYFTDIYICVCYQSRTCYTCIV